ncbi:sperm-associated antigen 5 isoform X5 [Castor canadensis]|uniref:Sperm-associated antigen 5 isoform X5 n=1 Tax=Castor canadensis TaxID=51338 RepID=A0AC58KCD9_CASCN
MWRVKTLNVGLSPSPQPRKPAMRTPLRELILQPGALTNSRVGPPMCSSLTPSLCNLGLQEDSNNSSPMDFVNARSTNFPSECLEACQHESDEQPLDPIPQTNSPPKTSEEALDQKDDYVVKTVVLVPSPVVQQQDMTLKTHLDGILEKNNSVIELLSPGDLVRKEMALCMEENFLEVVASMPEEPTFQDFPSHPLEYSPKPCSEQQLHYSKENLRDKRTEVVPEDLVLSESNAFSPSSMLWLSPSTAMSADFPINHVDPGKEMVEHRVIEERKMSFPILHEKIELGDKALIPNVEDVPSTCLTSNPVEMESQAAPGPAVEDAGRILCSDTETWMSPLAWLEKGVNTSVMLENLRQSLSLPSVLQDAPIGSTTLSTCSVGTWFTPPAPQEKTTGTKGTKDGTSETEHLLWGSCPPDLTALSRHDLEDNLLSSLGLLEVFSRQLQAWKSRLAIPHPETRDSATQTETSPSGAETVLEAFCAHASQRISQLKQDSTSMQEFRGLLQEAQTQLVGLQTEQEELAQQVVSLTSTLQQDWTSMQLDYGTWTALLNRSQQLTEKLTTKSRQALQERDSAIEEKQQVSRELEQVSAHLEDCKGQIEQLKLENSRLVTDLRAQLQMLASTASQLKELQSQHASFAQDLAMKDELLHQLTQSNEKQAAHRWQKEEMALKQIKAELQQQKAVLAKEVQELKETLEFADQESQVAHLELGQVEYQLKTTLEVLRERSLQCENLKDTVENLKAHLASTIAENQEQALEKAHQYSQGLGLLTEQLQSLTLFLQTKLKEKTEVETLLLSTDCAPTQEIPPPNESASMGNISTAVADEESESAPVPLLGSDKSAFTRVTSVVSLQPTETPGLEKSLAEMRTTLLELQSLCTLLQESKEEAIEVLQRKICDLQGRLQAQEEQHQESQKAKEADIEKLHQALCLRYKNEKELQEVIQKQNEKILEQIDKNGELISLREEVIQLTHSLRHAETETKVLKETLAGQVDPTCQPVVTNWIQEKVCLSQEVDKLRLMFLEMKNEKAKLVLKYQSHRNILEENLRRSDTELKKLDDIVQHIYETLLSIPEVVRNCKELQGLLEFLS